MEFYRREVERKRVAEHPRRRGRLLGILAMGLGILVGCQSASSDKAEDTSTRLQTLQTLMSVYLVEGKPVQGEEPNQARHPSEDGFKAFVVTLAPHRKESFGVTDTHELFVSPRDGQPFVINNAMPSSGYVPAIWEQTGVNGQRYVIYADGKVEKVDEETFTKIKPKK